MPNHIFLWYGEDVTSMRQKLAAWRERFVQKSDDLLDLQEIDATDANFDALKQSVLLLPLFGDKRLVIVRGALTQTKSNMQTKIADLLRYIDETVVVLFWEEGGVKSDSSLLKALQDRYTVQYFAAPSENTLKKRASDWIIERGCEIDADALTLLLKRVGTDQDRLYHELEKLVLASSQNHIGKALVDDMIASAPETRIFALADAIFRHDPATAYQLLQSELAYGANPLQIIALLAGSVRRAMALIDSTKRGQDVSANPLLRTVKPYPLSKLRQMVRGTSLAQLTQYLTLLAWADYQCKTGQEPEAVLLSLLYFA